MILQLTKTCAIRESACTGWSYDEATDITTFFLVNKKTLSSKGNWCNIIPRFKASGAIWTDGKTMQQRR